MCSTIVEQSVQTGSTPFNIIEHKGKVESMSNGSLNRFKLDSVRFQHFFTLSTMLDDLFKRTEHLVQQSVECMLKEMLKPFKRALIKVHMLMIHVLWFEEI